MFLILLLILLILLAIYFFQDEARYCLDLCMAYLSMSLLVTSYRERLNPGEGEALSPSSEEKASICLVSGSITKPGDNPREYAVLSRERLQEYSDKYGYTLRYFTSPLEPSAPAIWQKVYAVREALEEGYDVVVWIDDDIWITNMEIPIEKFLSLSEKPLIFSSDMIDRPTNTINTGLYILRNTPLTQEFIKDTLRGRTELHGGVWNYWFCYEQSVMAYLLMEKEKYREAGVIFPKGVLQSYYTTPSWKEGDFSLHLAGASIATRNRVMHELKTRRKFSS